MLRVMDEDKPDSRKRTNWDRYIYFIVLGFVFIGLLYYLSNKFLFVRADGQVIYRSVSIRLTDDCRIVKFHKNEGDTVCAGDTLFAYIEDQNNDYGNAMSGLSGLKGRGNYNVPSELSWIDKEIYTIGKQMAINNVEASENKRLVMNYEKELDRVRNEVTLDVLPYNRLEQIKTDMARLNTRNATLRQDNGELSGLIRKLRDVAGTVTKARKYGNFSFAGGGNGNDEHSEGVAMFYSPIDGIVNRRFLNDYEVALKTDYIMSVQEKTKIFIRAYFEQTDLGNIAEKDTVDVKFPDKTKSKGYVRRLYFGTYPVPEEFQPRYEPIKRMVAADIYPINKEEESKWRLFNKLGVEITKFKY